MEVYRTLQPDWIEINARSTFALFHHFNQSLPANFVIPDPTKFEASAGVLWTNGLWFVSLTLSLIVSLLAILARQWLGEYRSRMRAHPKSARHWAQMHLVHSDGLEKWQMDAMIATMPVLLHIALFLFLAGLVILLVRLDGALCGFIAALSFITAVIYVMATLLPLWHEDCPSATPLLKMAKLAGTYVLSTHFAIRLWQWWTRLCARIAASRNPNPGAPLPRVRPPLRRDHSSAYPPPPIFDGRSFDIEETKKDVGVLVRMICDLPDPRDVEVAMQAIAGLHPMVAYQAIRNIHWLPERVAGMLDHVSASIHTPIREIRTATLMRALCALRVDLKRPTMDRVRDIARSAALRKTHDTFALLVVLECTNGEEWPLPSLRRLRSCLIEWYTLRNVGGYARDAPPPLMPETACRLLIALDLEVERQQSSRHATENDITSPFPEITVGLLAALALCLDTRASDGHRFTEPLHMRLLPRLIQSRPSQWSPSQHPHPRIKELDAWAAALQQAVLFEGDEREREKKVVWQVYLRTLEDFRKPGVSLNLEELNQILGPFKPSMGVRSFGSGTTIAAAGILANAVLINDADAWSPILRHVFSVIYSSFLSPDPDEEEDPELRRAAEALLPMITPDRRREPAARQSGVGTSIAQNLVSRTPEALKQFVDNSTLNLLQKHGELSFWHLLRRLTDPTRSSQQLDIAPKADMMHRVAMALLIKLQRLKFFGYNIAELASELLDNDWTLEVMRNLNSVDLNREMAALQFAQHARAVSPEWWQNLKESERGLFDTQDVDELERRQSFVERVEALGVCITCPEHISLRVDDHELAGIHEGAVLEASNVAGGVHGDELRRTRTGGTSIRRQDTSNRIQRRLSL